MASTAINVSGKANNSSANKTNANVLVCSDDRHSKAITSRVMNSIFAPVCCGKVEIDPEIDRYRTSASLRS